MPPTHGSPRGALGVVPGAGDRDRTDLPDRVKCAGLKWKTPGHQNVLIDDALRTLEWAEFQEGTHTALP